MTPLSHVPILVAILAAAAPLAAQVHRPDPPAVALSTDTVVEFRLTVTRTAEGITATCHEGCSWDTLDASNPRAIYRLTDHGIEPDREPMRAARPVEPPAFSIILNASGDGIAALCDLGCAWTSVSAVFGGQRYRIDERGILAGRPGEAGR